ncbi:hypothetical protein CY34DRAFT_800359 [Suillus luteus UH-Slu-Lm8-n1]|uniref:RBR-type E3 ubiquitin transferase n=1 Tax=Suillus luteus UH-Slu-Lm8-n1 TaxID=930992 RepID=A0A0D0B9Z8_9AGAM|nr:hypothetical protein CY34DRAFT_800359 [Suillus luteus UH-Slu-Lm8-n1]
MAVITSSDPEAASHATERFTQSFTSETHAEVSKTRSGTPLSDVSVSPQAYCTPPPCSPELKCGTQACTTNDEWRKAPQDRKAIFCLSQIFIKFMKRNQFPVECIACGDKVPPKQSFRAPCAHHYCRECIANFAKASMKDETLYPLQCCQIRMPAKKVDQKLPKSLQTRFRAKAVEYSVPPATRVYCANQKCSAFLCSSDTRKANMTCRVCGITMCLACKNRRHPGEGCVEAGLQRDLKSLADDKNWQSCPGCRAIVERTDGCSHITCRCSTHFCYRCGARWRKCFCHREDH